MGDAKAQVGKVAFEVTSFEDAVTRVLSDAARGASVAVRFANAWCVVTAEKDAHYSRVFEDGGLTFPDGAPVAWVMRRVVGASSAERVRGPSFFVRATLGSSPESHRHFLLGSTGEVLDTIERKFKLSGSDVSVAGTWAPRYGPLDDEFFREATARIQRSGANIVWIGLGSPKQDFAASQLAAATGCVCLGVGAAFDFYAGAVPEAPRFIQRMGFEWLFRLASEPRRLWRRYLVGNAQFIALVFQQRMKLRGGAAL